MLLRKDDIKKILTDIPFNKNMHITIEIIYLGQRINYFDISKMNQTLKDMNKKMENMEDRINKLERFFSSYGLKLPKNANKPK